MREMSANHARKVLKLELVPDVELHRGGGVMRLPNALGVSSSDVREDRLDPGQKRNQLSTLSCKIPRVYHIGGRPPSLSCTRRQSWGAKASRFAPERLEAEGHRDGAANIEIRRHVDAEICPARHHRRGANTGRDTRLMGLQGPRSTWDDHPRCPQSVVRAECRSPRG